MSQPAEKITKTLYYPDDFIDKFICGDALDIMREIPTGSVELVVTSPPYNLKNSTGNGMKCGTKLFFNMGQFRIYSGNPK